jgi:hypothetical protein
VRKAALSTLIIADGFSCREQIGQLSSRNALHLAEVIDQAFAGDKHAETYPEGKVVGERRQSRRKARWQAFGGLFVVVAGAVLLTRWKSKREQGQWR